MTRSGKDFDGQVVLVIGASRGIGAATARAFAARGARVVVAARTLDALEAVAADIRIGGGDAVATPLDVTDASAVRDAVETVVDRYGRLDAAVNNATFNPRPARLADTDDEDFAAAIRANLTGTFFAMKQEIRAMLRHGGGSIVNTSSGAGVQPVSMFGPYVAGKAALNALSRVAALDHAEQGIRVNVVAPGPILTEHLAAAGGEAQRQAAAAVPMARTGTIDDVTETILFLSSPAAAFITGAVVPIDGGQLAGQKLDRVYDQGRGMTDGG